MPKKKLFTSGILIFAGILFSIIYIKINDGNNMNFLLINEVCSHNNTIIYNDIGIYTDYIELYNNTEEVINLSDFYLSDKKEKLDLYALPDISLEPFSYSIIFIEQNVAGFAVGDDESIYLSDAEGNIVDIATLPNMADDMVYARNADTLQWEVGQAASPGEANTIEREQIQRLKNSEPVLSAKSGFYEEPFYLEITADNNYEIYYTLDGSIPTEESLFYEEPILIADVSGNPNVYSAIEEISVDEDEIGIPEHLVDKCNIVRAVAIDAEGAVSEEVYGTYFVGFDEKYGYGETYVISVITDPDNLFSKDRGIYVNGNLADKHWYGVEEPGSVHDAITNYSREGKGWEKPAYVELFDTNGDLMYEHSVEISIHGNHNVTFAQKGFNLLLDSSNDEKYIFDGLFSDGNTSLMLRPGGSVDWKRTQFRDVLNHTLVEDRDLTVLHAVPCQVFLDGEYWGLYNLQERIDKGLIAENYGVDEEDVIVTKNSKVVGEDDSYYELYTSVVSYAETHDLSIEEYYAEMEKKIDIQSYIDYYCFTIYVAACDTVVNNYSCWRTKEISTREYYDGRWRWVLYDTDDSLGVRNDFTLADVDSFSEGHISKAPMDDVLFTSLMENEGFKRQFVTTFVEMADTNFEVGRVNRLIDELCDNYMEASVISHIRFGREESEEKYLENVEVIRDFFENRRVYIMEHLENNLGIEDVEVYLETE